jgi:hypothetical protein
MGTDDDSDQDGGLVKVIAQRLSDCGVDDGCRGWSAITMRVAQFVMQETALPGSRYAAAWWLSPDTLKVIFVSC